MNDAKYVVVSTLDSDGEMLCVLLDVGMSESLNVSLAVADSVTLNTSLGDTVDVLGTV